MPDPNPQWSEQIWADVRAIWDFHQLGHTPSPSSAAVVLGSFDLRVAAHAAELYHAGLFPWLVVTGANSPTTRARFPSGEAVAYRAHALSLGVPDEVILVEPHATHTGENVAFARDLLRRHGVEVTDLLVVGMPSMPRRAYATWAKQWPEVSVSCVSEPITMEDYLQAMPKVRRTVDEIVGDLQRIWVHAARGFAIEQSVPEGVLAAYHRLVAARFDSKILDEPEWV